MVTAVAARAQPFGLKAPAIESIKLDAEIDASDQFKYLDQQVHVHLVHQVQDGMLFTIEGNRSSNVQGFSDVMSRMDKLFGFDHVPA